MHEFMAISSDLNADTIGDEWAARRRDEFKDIIDLNHDGVATKDEIEVLAKTCCSLCFTTGLS